MQNLQISVCRPKFFPRLDVAKINFVFNFKYTGDTLCQVWFNLDNSLNHSTILCESKLNI